MYLYFSHKHNVESTTRATEVRGAAHSKAAVRILRGRAVSTKQVYKHVYMQINAVTERTCCYTN